MSLEVLRLFVNIYLLKYYLLQDLEGNKMKNHTLKISASLMLLICSSVAVADPGYSMSDGMGGYYNSYGSSSMSDGMGGFYHSD